MPRRPLRPCSKIGCRRLTTERYCEEHAHIAQQQAAERHRHYDRYKRDKSAADFYHSIEWIRLREQALIRDHGLCQDCIDEQRVTPADVVDHIKPIRQFWHLRLTLSNLRSLCHAHHNRKTAEDARKYVRSGK